MKPDLLRKQIKMGTAIYPARSAVEHTGLWLLLLPLITPQQLHGEHTEWLWTLQSCVFDYRQEQECGYLKIMVNIHEISLPPCPQHTSGKPWRLCLFLVISREEGKENNSGQTSQIQAHQFPLLTPTQRTQQSSGVRALQDIPSAQILLGCATGWSGCQTHLLV